MHFNILIFLAAVVAASPADNHQLKELPEVDVVVLGNGISLYDLAHEEHGSAPSSRAPAACPPGFPLYCPAYNFCCPIIAIGCCPLACCAPGATFCQNGHCYGPA